MGRVPLVLRQVKRDPAHHPPQRMALLQPRAGASRVAGHFDTHQLVQAAPEPGQHLRIQIFAAAHRRSCLRQRRKVGLRRRRQRGEFLHLFQARRMAELRQKAPGQLPPPRARRGQDRVEFPRAQVQQPARRQFRERRRHPPPRLNLGPGRRWRGVLHEQKPVGRQNHVRRRFNQVRHPAHCAASGRRPASILRQALAGRDVEKVERPSWSQAPSAASRKRKPFHLTTASRSPRMSHAGVSPYALRIITRYTP